MTSSSSPTITKMFNHLLIAVLIAVTCCIDLSSCAANTAYSSKKCERLLMVTDKCFQRALLVGERTAKIPSTAEELLEGHCKRVKNDIPCMRRYGVKCLTPLPRTLFNLGYRTAIKLYKKICFTQEGQDGEFSSCSLVPPHHVNLTSYVPLLNEPNRMVKTCKVHEARTTINGPYVHGYDNHVYEDAERDLHSYCDSVTGPETVDYILGMVKATSADMIDMGCGRYSSVKNCKTHFSDGMKIMDEMITPKSKIKKMEYSPVVPSVRVLQRLDTLALR